MKIKVWGTIRNFHRNDNVERVNYTAQLDNEIRAILWEEYGIDYQLLAHTEAEAEELGCAIIFSSQIMRPAWGVPYTADINIKIYK